MSQSARHHHYVPQFLLKPWARDGKLHGYYWDSRRKGVSVRILGTKSFCHEPDLLTINLPRTPPDALETNFFGRVDALGAAARAKMLKCGPDGLTAGERSDFSRLLFSLVYRRPQEVDNLRKNGPQLIAQALDDNPELRDDLRNRGSLEDPSVYGKAMGLVSEDWALVQLQKLVGNPSCGAELNNWHWHIVRTEPRHGTFILSDRPLVLFQNFDHPEAHWILPLEANACFVAVNRGAKINLSNLREFVKRINKLSVDQAQKYVFCTDNPSTAIAENLPKTRHSQT